MASMTNTTSAWLLLIFLPFLLALAGKAPMPKMLCLVTSLLALLMSVEPGRSVLPWGIGMILALVSLWERFRPI
ncbi:MAG TPA: hypothetical protein VKY22_23070 [Bradyrhizobium sp.]|nr:hypothetical protein [Bradyrhizobium sp.]